MTTPMQKLRPLFLSDAMPKITPTPAIRMMSQFAKPSNGMKAGIARIRAMMPRMNAMIFAMEH